MLREHIEGVTTNSTFTVFHLLCPGRANWYSIKKYHTCVAHSLTAIFSVFPLKDELQGEGLSYDYFSAVSLPEKG